MYGWVDTCNKNTEFVLHIRNKNTILVTKTTARKYSPRTQ